MQAAETLVELEDIYLPFRPRRRTRATIAKERGLEPLARMIFAQEIPEILDPEKEAAAFVDAEKGVASTEEALNGAKDIIAEWISEDAEARFRMRALFQSEGVIRTQATADGVADDDAGKFRDYLDLSLPIARVSSHRLMAMLRAARNDVISLHVAPAEDESLAVLEELFIKGDGPASRLVSEAAEDGFRRLLAPSIENETLAAARTRAEEKAIEVFADNLRQLLLDPPSGQKCVLALDPGFRTGCKLVVLDSLGRPVMNDVIYPHEPHKRTREAKAMVQKVVEEWRGGDSRRQRHGGQRDGGLLEEPGSAGQDSGNHGQ